jgi:hypothetical protein
MLSAAVLCYCLVLTAHVLLLSLLLQLQADHVYDPATHDFHGAGLPSATTSQVALTSAGAAGDAAGASGSARGAAHMPEAEVVPPAGHSNKV